LTVNLAVKGRRGERFGLTPKPPTPKTAAE
jgi:hypothetical protein